MLCVNYTPIKEEGKVQESGLFKELYFVSAKGEVGWAMTLVHLSEDLEALPAWRMEISPPIFHFTVTTHISLQITECSRNVTKESLQNAQKMR